MQLLIGGGLILKRKGLLLFLIGIFFITAVIITAFFLRQSKNRPDTGKSHESEKTIESTPSRQEQSPINFTKFEQSKEYVKPTASGPIDILPWENDERFINARDKSRSTVLMAAYCTVLPDPLPGEEYNVQLAASMLAGSIVNSEEIFSQNQSIGPYNESRGFREGPTYNGTKLTTTIGGGVCKIASTLYNVAVLSNLSIVERHPHGMPVPYVPYGQDATVAYGSCDFKFKNTTPYPILIWAQGIDNTLCIAFYGKDKPPSVEWYHEKGSIKKAKEVYIRNPSLPSGERKLVHEGMDGAVVKSWVIIKNQNGTSTKKYLGVSRYKPMDYLIEFNDHK